MSQSLHQCASPRPPRPAARLEPAADPRQTFADLSQRHRALQARVQQALSQNDLTRHQLEARWTQLQAALPHLLEQARLALTEKRAELARSLLHQRQWVLTEIESLQVDQAALHQDGQRLGLGAQQLQAHMETFRTHPAMLAARPPAADTQAQLAAALASLAGELAELGVALEQAELKIEHLQAYITTLQQRLTDGGLAMPGLPSGEFLFPPAGASLAQSVESQLATLMGELGLAPHPAANNL